MGEALQEARAAARMGEVPVGCVVVNEEGIVARAHNERESRRDPTAHAELLALRRAAQRIGTWHLTGCTLVVTLEPCPMCAGALTNSRIDGLVYGATDPKAGACGTLLDIPSDGRLNHTFLVVAGVRREECARLLSDFFAALRTRAREDRPCK